MTQQFSAKHWAEKARKQATGTPAECPAGSAQVWAVGTIDQCPNGSAKHWADDARQTADSVKTGLPDQTNNGGKFLSTDGTQAFWANALANNATASTAMAAGPDADAADGGIALGVGATSGAYAVSIGESAKATAARAVQLGAGTNATAGSLSFGNDTGNYTLLNADGTIPSERLSHVVMPTITYWE